jgi:hypothetical protein
MGIAEFATEFTEGSEGGSGTWLKASKARPSVFRHKRPALDAVAICAIKPFF